MEAVLTQRGHELVPVEDGADAFIINTCTVTAVSDKKCRQMIRRFKRQNPQAVVAVCGCYAQTKPEEIQALEVDLISGTGDRMAFLDALEEELNQRSRQVLVDNAMKRRAFEVLPAGGMQSRTRAMLKVEDGCVNFCTYCIIPFARGPVRSLPLSQAIADTKALAEEGYQELTITGIEISSWGQDLKNGLSLIDLLEGVCQAAPGVRVRLGSLEPRTITEEFCQRASKLENLCPHFHLSLQSGCDATLKRMNRKYDTARYLESCALLRQYFPRPAITTDLITGFPGETEEEFGETLDLIRQANFAAMHIFPYSRRTGTKAADMEGQVPNEVKESRAHRASALAGEMQRAYLSQFVGEQVQVLFEEEKEGLWRGHTPNYMEVHAPSDTPLHNRLAWVTVHEVGDGCLVGELAER
jgi:threonylcarbamoyladenosine tRNA methylthiotransferase MtaB